MKNLCGTFEYKGYKCYVFFEGEFTYTVICNGKEVCTSTSFTRAKEKFMLLVDSGLKIEVNNPMTKVLGL